MLISSKENAQQIVYGKDFFDNDLSSASTISNPKWGPNEYLHKLLRAEGNTKITNNGFSPTFVKMQEHHVEK